MDGYCTSTMGVGQVQPMGTLREGKDGDSLTMLTVHVLIAPVMTMVTTGDSQLLVWLR